MKKDTHPMTPEEIAAREAAQVTRATGTPLALTFELVGCQLATPHFTDETQPDGTVLPVPVPASYTYHQPCPWGNSAPDQECRDCRLHTITRIGTAERVNGQHRYPASGVVLPVTLAQADAVVDYLEATHAVIALTRPRWQAHAAALAVEAAAQEARQAAQRATDAQQQGKRA